MVQELKIGNQFHFKGVLLNGEIFDSNQIKTQKVISFFPKLNTKICDFQTLKMLDWSKQYPKITFISTSMDSIKTAQGWCQAHKVHNLIFLSDAKFQDFAKKTGLYLTDKHMLKRGLILLDQKNIVEGLAINPDISQEPDYQMIERLLKK